MTTRRPVHRDDGELVGFVVPESERWRPTTVFGAAIGALGEHDDVVELVRATGLAQLAERWEVHLDGTWVRVEIVEAAPDRVRVQVTEPDRYGEQLDLPAPTERLRPA